MDEFSLIQYIGSSLIAAVIGFLTGIFGVGGGFVGTWFGSNVGLKLEGLKIRKYFIFIVIAAIIMVTAKLANMLWGKTQLFQIN